MVEWATPYISESFHAGAYISKEGMQRINRYVKPWRDEQSPGAKYVSVRFWDSKFGMIQSLIPPPGQCWTDQSCIDFVVLFGVLCCCGNPSLLFYIFLITSVLYKCYNLAQVWIAVFVSYASTFTSSSDLKQPHSVCNPAWKSSELIGTDARVHSSVVWRNTKGS